MLKFRHFMHLLIIEGIPEYERKNSNKKKAQPKYSRVAFRLRNPFTCFSNGIIQRLTGFADFFAHGYRLMV